MNALRWHVLSIAAAAGLPGFAAVLLLTACAIVWLAIDQPAQQHATDLRDDNARLAARLRDPARRAAATPPSAQASLAGFEARFPDERRITEVLAGMRRTASRHGIALERGEFKVQTGPDEALAQYQMVLPLKADYRALRRFVRELLREQPAIALDEVTLRRDDAKSPTVEAQLHLVLFISRR